MVNLKLNEDDFNKLLELIKTKKNKIWLKSFINESKEETVNQHLKSVRDKKTMECNKKIEETIKKFEQEGIKITIYGIRKHTI